MDPDQIQVFDRLVAVDLRERITAYLQRPIWQYGWKSNKKGDRFSYWHASIAGGDDKSRVNCEAELASSRDVEPIAEMWQCLSHGHLTGHEPLRIYANSHTFGVEGYVHIDNEDPNNYFTTIYYAHPEWHRNWAGELVFYGADQDEIIGAVYPRPGRVVTFHGNIPHAARAPSRECAALRISLVIKTQVTSRATR
jgi:SM-20-related protein